MVLILLWQFQTISEHFGLVKMPKGQIGHSESIWTTLVRKYLKVAKLQKLAIPNQFRPLW